jgi:hypothetical protein
MNRHSYVLQVNYIFLFILVSIFEILQLTDDEIYVHFIDSHH